MSLSDSTTKAIYEAAINYANQGLSVIPVFMNGNSPKNKLPRGFNDSLLPWSVFQERPANIEMITYWYEAGLFSQGLAIITGHISKDLLVIDFDKLNLLKEFKRRFPELAKTLHIKSPNGDHYYFKLRPGVVAQSRQLPGVDVQWEGRYVVASPTQGYSVIEGRKRPRLLSQAEYNALIRFLTPDENPTPAHTNLSQQNSAHNNLPLLKPTVQTVISLYRQLQEHGRNYALFRACCFARDNGISIEELLHGGLQDIFVYSQHSSGKQESERRRLKEYRRTVASAYKKCPALQHSSQNQMKMTISDDARQKLHEGGQSNTARGLDVLALYIQPGMQFTRKMAYQATQGIMDWKCVNRALNADFEGEYFFEKQIPSPHPNPYEAIAEKTDQNNVYFGWKKTEKTKIGRKPELFVMPSAEKIQQITGAKFWSSTAITEDDLQSVRSYRTKLNTARIERTQHYKYHDQKWLARCLGVTDRTIRTYINFAYLHTQERYIYVQNVTVDNVKGLEFASFPPSYFLFSDTSGRKYPVDDRIARILLQRKHNLSIRRQGANRYSTTEPALKQELEQLHQKQFNADFKELIQRYRNGDSLETIVKRYEKPNPVFAANKALYAQGLRRPVAPKEPPKIALQQLPISELIEVYNIKPELQERFTQEVEIFARTLSPELYKQLAEVLCNIVKIKRSENAGEISADEAYVRDVFAEMDFKIAYHSRETWAGMQGISTPSDAAIQRRQRRAAQDNAKILTMLLPPVDGKRQLSKKNAVQLILEYGAERCHRVAMQVNIESQLSQAVRNPTGMLISRLRKGGGQ